jgi:hypothetical protein
MRLAVDEIDRGCQEIAHSIHALCASAWTSDWDATLRRKFRQIFELGLRVEGSPLDAPPSNA